MAASAFVYDFNDLQVSTTFFDGPNVIVDIDNAAKAEVHGVDMAGSIHLSDRLRFSAGLVWVPKREFIDFRDNPTGGNLTGNKMSRSPEWTATSAIDYELPLRGLGALSARLEYNYRSDFFFTIENDPINAQNDFGLLNLLLRFESIDERWYAFASGRNLTNTNYFTQVFIQSSPGYPDTYEIGFGLRF